MAKTGDGEPGQNRTDAGGGQNPRLIGNDYYGNTGNDERGKNQYRKIAKLGQLPDGIVRTFRESSKS